MSDIKIQISKQQLEKEKKQIVDALETPGLKDIFKMFGGTESYFDKELSKLKKDVK